MTSAYKTWLYIDNLAKPQEEILYRYPDDGGLGCFNIQWKSQAHLISSFLETVFGDKFLVSPFHKALFDKFLLGEKIKKITRPPYYSEAFFNNIKEALRSQEDIFHWKSGDWYRYFLKKFITHTPGNIDGELQLILSRSEIIYPQIDHTNSTRIIRQANLPPRIRTSLFLMKNDILPNKERLLRFVKTDSGNCERCEGYDNQGHFLICTGLADVNKPTLAAIRSLLPGISLESIINCDLIGEPNAVFAATWMIGSLTSFLWNRHSEYRCYSIVSFEACLRSELKILKAISKIKDKYILLKNIISQSFDIVI